ncbi:MAG: STAS domain-containing protein [Clostridiales bacterium]|nr:STAS domain-containing protein [Clostridiales bacterium]
MEIIKNKNDQIIVLSLNGKLDSNTSMVLEKEIDNILALESFSELEIDMRELTYLSSAGLRVLLGVQKKLNSIEGKLVISNANETIKSVFEITGFMGILNIV